MSLRLEFLLAVVTLAACPPPWEFFPACDDGTGCAPTSSTNSTSGYATTTGGVPTGDIQTVASGSSEPGSTSADTPSLDLPPDAPILDADPAKLKEAGTTQLKLHNIPPDIESVELKLNGKALADLTPGDFPFTWEAFSEKDNGEHTFEARIKNKKGQSETLEAKVSVKLPPPGSVRCSFPADLASEPPGTFSAILYTEDAIIVGGWRDIGSGARMVVHKLDPDFCTPQAGWPRMFGDWTGDPALASKFSVVTALTLDEHGNIVVGGNLLEGSLPQRYTVMLTPQGDAIAGTEVVGLVGETVSGVAITPGPTPIVVAVGWWTVSENPLSTDWRWWRIHAADDVNTLGSPAPWAENEQPDVFNHRSERARAILLHPDTGILYIVGDREYRDDANHIFTRTWATRVDAWTGAMLGSPWTSPGDGYYEHDATMSLALCGERLIGSGWTQRVPINTSKRQQLTRWIEFDGTSTHRIAEAAPSEGFGAACDREAKAVVAGKRSTTDLDAQVFAFIDAEGPRIPFTFHMEGDDAALGVACDPRGFCAWPGYRTVDGHPVGVVQVHHP